MGKFLDALQRAGVSTALPDPVTPEPGLARLGHDTEHARELVQLYYSVDALRADAGPLVLQFVAATPGEGTSTVAWGFAAVARAERTQSVLFVDCTPGKSESAEGTPGTSLVEAFKSQEKPSAAATPVPGMPNVSRARLSSTPHSLLSFEPAEFRRLIDWLRAEYQLTVLDTPAATTTPDSIALSRYCDGTILVVRAEAVKTIVVESTKRDIERAGGQVIGAVLNRRRLYIPDWLYNRL